MNPQVIESSTEVKQAAPAAADAVSRPTAREQLDQIVDQAVRRVAPLWPLEHFVAVNPWFGLADLDLEQAARRQARTAGARMTMPRRFYVDALNEGRIRDRHLEDALADAHVRALADAGRHDLLPTTVEALKAHALADPDAETSSTDVLPTVATVAARLTGTDWQTAVVERISFWAGSYFDQGQASWACPHRDEAPYLAWKREAQLDRTLEILGLPGFRAFVAELPSDAHEAIALLIARLGVPDKGLELYLHRVLMTVGGWTAWARYHQWQAELYGHQDDTPAQVLAVCLAYEVALLTEFEDEGIEAAWTAARSQSAQDLDLSGPFVEMQVDLVLQNAFEAAWHEDMVARFAANARKADIDETGSLGVNALGGAASEVGRGVQRASVQAAFCIDVRSEVFRRALEAQDPGIRTVGFAGFFGFPIEVVPVAADQGGSCCPVLLTPAATVRQSADDDDVRTAELVRQRTLRRTAKAAWMSFKMGAVSCFGFVGPVGLAYAAKLFGDGFGLTRPVSHPQTESLSKLERQGLKPSIVPHIDAQGRATGFDAQQRLDTAEGVLRAMSMTTDFAELVLLVGHGSTTVNNPHATGLDCGACGGHTGEANARVAAAVLNDPAVRKGLVSRGIEVPDDTWFVAGVHDTTTDEVALYDLDVIPVALERSVQRLKGQLAAAGGLARAERAQALGIDPVGVAASSIDRRVLARSRDWSQVRPEWGLAGCAAFVAAPRERTAGLDLAGRSFLHDYDWSADAEFGVLELIMTAPMVVASWISLQYYGSTVDNATYGCGNKVLHNVVGTFGVLEGNGGDLRTGLPWQSVHDGTRPVHEPLRLNVIIEAPIDAMNAIIARHEHVAHLLDNGWLNLWQMDERGALVQRYDRDLEWTPVDAPASSRSASQGDERVA